MVGDRQCTWNGSTTTEIIKVFRVKKGKEVFLIGFAGNPSEGLRYIEHFKKYPLRDKLEDFEGTEVLIVSKKGMWAVEEDTDTVEIISKQWAIGRGKEYAFGAMFVGATAVEALEVAIALDINTGMGINTVKF